MIVISLTIYVNKIGVEQMLKTPPLKTPFYSICKWEDSNVAHFVVPDIEQYDELQKNEIMETISKIRETFTTKETEYANNWFDNMYPRNHRAYFLVDSVENVELILQSLGWEGEVVFNGL